MLGSWFRCQMKGEYFLSTFELSKLILRNLEISWVMPKVPVRTIALYFRSSYINAADLKVFYEPLDVWHGETEKALFEVTSACLNEKCQSCMVSNLFDGSIYSFFFSNYIAECSKNPIKHLMTKFEVFYHLIHD